MDAAPRIQWVPCEESNASYRARAFCSMSRLAKLLRLREQAHWHEVFVERAGDDSHEALPSEFGARMMLRGQQYEALVWRALLHYVPHWRQCGVQARPAELYVSALDKPLVGCTDYILFRQLLEPPGERAAVEIKVVQKRNPPPEHWGEHVPVDYLPQLEACMRALHCEVSYLVVLHAFEDQPLPLRDGDTDDVTQCGPPGVACTLHVWEVRRDQRFWQTWLEPRLRLVQQKQQEWARSVQHPALHPYRPTRMQGVKASRQSADALRMRRFSRLVLQAVWDGTRWLPPRTHFLKPAHQLPIVRYMECSAVAEADRPWLLACSEAPEDSTTEVETETIEEPAWLAALESEAPPSDRSAGTDSAIPAR